MSLTGETNILEAFGFGDRRNTDEGEYAQSAELQSDTITDLWDATAETAPRYLTFRVDRSLEPLTVTLPQLTGTLADDLSAIALAITEQAKRARKPLIATPSADRLTLKSTTKGVWSRVEVVVDDTPDLLGFTEFPTNRRIARGSNIASGTDYNRVQVKSHMGLADNDWARIDDGITQNWHQITLRRDTDAEGNPLYFVEWSEPTDDAEKNEYQVEDDAAIQTDEFDLEVFLQSAGQARPQKVESWERLSFDPSPHKNYAERRVNDSNTGSSYIVLTPTIFLTPSGDPVPFHGHRTPRTGQGIRLGRNTPTAAGLTVEPGSDGDPPSTSDFRNALSRFNTVAIQLLAILEAMPAGMLDPITRDAIAYAQDEATKGDCLFVGHTPDGWDAEAAKEFGQNLQQGSREGSYGALYWPWIVVTDPIGTGPNPTRLIPPTGHVLGVYSRIDRTRGIWKAPAGNEAVLRGALAVEHDITDRDHTDLVKNGSVNGIRQLRGTGIVIDASRTLSTDSRWLYVNVRLLFNYVKASLREGMRWAKQEPNRERLWNTIKYGTVTPFLQRLYQAGAFGPGAPEEVYTIICGPENNPPDQIQLGNLTVEIYFYPARPAETIIIIIGQSGATASEQ